jgi:CubicO group peptidase (beta-lactamase class C family)
MTKKIFTRIILVFILISFAGATWFVWPRLPIITAFAAKGMCSSVFLAEKAPERVQTEDLSFFPINLAKTTVDFEEQSATSTVFGLARRKAIFREGNGAVIVLQTPEDKLRKSWFKVPDPGYTQDTVPWPKGNVLADTLPAGVNYRRLNELLDTCFDRTGAEPYKKTLGIAVIYKNQLIAERYLNGYDSNTLFHGWSMTKSLTGAWAGILAERGLLNLDEPVGIDIWKEDDRSGITVKNVIQMSTGLNWYENYFTISDATVMLMQSEDMLAAVTGNKLIHPAGSFWNYSSGDANLLSAIIRQRINDDQLYQRSLYSDLLHPVGMLSTKVETDASGLFIASSYSYGTVRDWARFGLLFLNNGVFAGDTILSADWVQFMKTPVEASNGKYAGTFWLHEPEEKNALVNAPSDIYFADGFLGQRVYIIPSRELVVVRMGFGMTNFNLNNFLREVIITLPE